MQLAELLMLRFQFIGFDSILSSKIVANQNITTILVSASLKRIDQLLRSLFRLLRKERNQSENCSMASFRRDEDQFEQPSALEEFSLPVRVSSSFLCRNDLSLRDSSKEIYRNQIVSSSHLERFDLSEDLPFVTGSYRCPVLSRYDADAVVLFSHRLRVVFLHVQFAWL